MRYVTLKSGEKVPVLGLGTWRMGERKSERAAEVKALQVGLDLGLHLIDTAEMYGEGGAEEVVAEAIGARRDKIYLVSKVYPHNASRKGAIAACDRSLKRLKTDHLDLYLLHWRGSYPLAETVEAFEVLKKDGKIRQWGVSNFDVDDMEELAKVANGRTCASNQVMYNIETRVGQGPLLRKPAVKKIADKHGTAPASIALAWILRQPNVVVIPKASNLEHVRANASALEVKLDEADLEALDTAFPPPKRPSRLSMT
jgi:diketogulonate reductase-like aldo/keto reductase